MAETKTPQWDKLKLALKRYMDPSDEVSPKPSGSWDLLKQSLMRFINPDDEGESEEELPEVPKIAPSPFGQKAYPSPTTSSYRPKTQPEEESSVITQTKPTAQEPPKSPQARQGISTKPAESTPPKPGEYQSPKPAGEGQYHDLSPTEEASEEGMEEPTYQPPENLPPPTKAPPSKEPKYTRRLNNQNQGGNVPQTQPKAQFQAAAQQGSPIVKAREVLTKFSQELDQVTDVAVLRQVKQASSFLKDRTAQFAKFVRDRYGIAGGTAILASGQALGWGVFAAGTAMGIPAWVPGGSILFSLPGVAVAEAIVRLNQAMKTENKSLELTPEQAAEIFQEFADKLGQEYIQFLLTQGIISEKDVEKAQREVETPQVADSPYGKSFNGEGKGLVQGVDSKGRRYCRLDGRSIDCGAVQQYTKHPKQKQAEAAGGGAGGAGSKLPKNVPPRLTLDKLPLMKDSTKVVIWTDVGGHAEVSSRDEWSEFGNWASKLNNAPELSKFVMNGWTDKPGNILAEFATDKVGPAESDIISRVMHDVLKALQTEPESRTAVVTVDSQSGATPQE